jgi:hypothetical protein
MHFAACFNDVIMADHFFPLPDAFTWQSIPRRRRGIDLHQTA